MTSHDIYYSAFDVLDTCINLNILDQADFGGDTGLQILWIADTSSYDSLYMPWLAPLACYWLGTIILDRGWTERGDRFGCFWPLFPLLF